jgi:mitogen-activated protein kinase kinase
MERDNRKSHLAPQLSPATQDLLRSTDSPTFFNQTITAASVDDRSMQTPTSGEIPIMGTVGSSRDQYSGVHRVPEQRSANRSPPPPTTRGAGATGEAAAVGGGEWSSRASGSPVYPGMGSRMMTTGAIPQQQQQQPYRTRETVLSVGGPRSAGRAPATFTLPVRPGGSGGSRPPPPPRKETAEERRESTRRQAAAFSPPAQVDQGGYGYGSYANQ